MDFEFANKEYLFLLLLVLPYVLWYVMFRHKSEPTIRMADTTDMGRAQRTWRVRLMPVQPVLRILAFTLLVLAMARPQTHNAWEDQTIEGIDIMLTMDVSTSMLAVTDPDQMNRIDQAIEVASEFVNSRPNDNIGLTIFAGEAFAACPLTIDHTSLLSLLANAKDYMGRIEDMTAMGLGIETSVNRLKDSKAESRVIILLTDGNYNYGEITPQMAAETAKQKGIRIYVIGVREGDTALYPQEVGGFVQWVMLPNELDEDALRQIAETGNGKYYRATNIHDLRDIYSDIDKLEKSKLDVQKFSKTHDHYQPLILAAIIALLLEILLRITIFRRIP